MVVSANGIFILEGEMTVILAAMKRGARWSSRDRVDDILVHNFADLKEILNSVDVDNSSFLNPFLELIRSPNTTGPITGLALSAVNKFLAYGLIDPSRSWSAAAVESIADAVTHARFLGTDPGSDEVVLLKILHVLRTLFLAPCGALLTNESVCEIMQSCFRICFEMRLSELLRKVAEHALMDMIQLLFSRLSSMTEEKKSGINVKTLKMRTGEINTNKGKRKNSARLKRRGDFTKQPVDGKLVDPEHSCRGADISKTQFPKDPGKENERLPEFTADLNTSSDSLTSDFLEDSKLSKEDVPKDGHLEEEKQGQVAPIYGENVISLSMNEQKRKPSECEENEIQPYGLPSIRELFRFMVSLINPSDKNNSESMAMVGLCLLSVALETGADSFGQFPTLLILVKDELCRNLLQLLSSERLFIIAATLRVCLLLFESLRTHLKFQLEHYLEKLMEIITTESPKISYEHKEMALESVVALWRMPGLVTELYLNYDCDLYCSNLYEELVKMLSKNTFPVNGLYSTHLLSLDALLTVIDSIESQCHSRILRDPSGSNLKTDTKKDEDWALGWSTIKTSRHKVSDNIPSHELLMAIKHKKKLLATGSEHFNAKPNKGIGFMQENGLLKTPIDSLEVATFLKENHRLDKKMIGEFISSRKNLSVLQAFVESFDFGGLRIDEALRQYLETFRLPGEAPLISLIMEHFADHWHKSNNEPFVNADAAFTLGYAIIMLNVDQHNHNVKKHNIPMTLEEFTRNLKGVNGGEDFSMDLLQEIYDAIRGEEIVMPAEQTGIVRENYLWKVLLRKGSDRRGGEFVHAPIGSLDHDLFSLIWGPSVAALSYVLDKSNDKILIQKALAGFRKCAMISAHYGMSDVFDNLAISLCKFTMLLNSNEGPDQIIVNLGTNYKVQMAARTVFSLSHRHGDILREGWKNLLDCIYQLYRCGLLSEEMTKVEDFVDPSGYVLLKPREEAPRRPEAGLLSSIYSYIAMTDSPKEKLAEQEQEEFREKAKECVALCQPEQLISDSKFLRTDSFQELIKALIFASSGPDQAGGSADEDCTIFFMELLVKIVMQNRERALGVGDHLYSTLMRADHSLLLERCVVSIVRLSMALPMATQSLGVLLLLKPSCLRRVSRQIAYALHDLLRANAANIHECSDWSMIFTLMECVGAGARPPQPVSSSPSSDQGTASEKECDGGRGYTSDSELYSNEKLSNQRSASLEQINPGSMSLSSSGWILVREPDLVWESYDLCTNVEFVLWDPKSFLRCVETIAFLVRDLAHITPANFAATVRTCRVFVEASMREGKGCRFGKKKMVKANKKRDTSSSPYDADDDSDSENGCSQAVLQLLDLMHALHTRAGNVFRAWEEQIGPDISLWPTCWCPLLQGIARLCTSSNRQVRRVAVTYLQRALLVHDLQTLSALEWESCFNQVLFPLLSKLLEPLSPNDPTGIEETRVYAATLLSKVFLQHLTPLLSLPTFTTLWMTILEFMDKYMLADKGDLLYEAIPESLKNMLLVTITAGVFDTNLWNKTWDRIDQFLPELKPELVKPHHLEKKEETEVGKNVESVEVKNVVPDEEAPVEEQDNTPQSEQQSESRVRAILVPPLPTTVLQAGESSSPTDHQTTSLPVHPTPPFALLCRSTSDKVESEGSSIVLNTQFVAGSTGSLQSKDEPNPDSL